MQMKKIENLRGVAGGFVMHKVGEINVELCGGKQGREHVTDLVASITESMQNKGEY